MSSRVKDSKRTTNRKSSSAKKDDTGAQATPQNSEQDDTSAVTEPKGRTKASQGKGWRSVFDVAKRLVASRPDDHISSILSELREVNIGRKDPGRYYRVKDIGAPLAKSVLDRENKTLDNQLYYPNVVNGKYTLGSLTPIRYLSQLIRPNTTAVMELGSGWSSNIFQIYIAHGASRSKKIIYYGGEYTREGQVCAKFLAGQDEHLKYRSFQFDFREPEVSFLCRQRGHILLFTHHSIEQVDLICPSLFEQLKEIANDITVVHFEPIGWQRNEELMAMREAGNDEFFMDIAANVEAGDIEDLDRNSAWWSWRLKYNMNLLKIVRDLEKENAIKIVNEEYNFSGTANILNPTTLLHYELVR